MINVVASCLEQRKNTKVPSTLFRKSDSKKNELQDLSDTVTSFCYPYIR